MVRRVDGKPRAARLAEAEAWFRRSVVPGFPARWQAAFVREWNAGGDIGAMRACAVAVKAALDASYDELRAHAATAALLCRQAMMTGSLSVLRRCVRTQCERHGVKCDADAMSMCAENDGDDVDRWRVCDDRWWLGRIRRAHAAAVESTARNLRMVGARADKYISRESMERAAQQRRRNRRMVESHDVVADDGEVVALARVAERSTANAAIRRGELMTRIKGLESCAESLGHAAIFVTTTCPSRFHFLAGSASGKKIADGVEKNLSDVRGAQKHLLAVWSRIRAALHRAGVAIYGMRIAEPHRDGCPHHHYLLFCAREHVADVRRAFLRYALEDSGSEPGALAHRVKWVPLSGSGAAAAYVAKYVSKSIDGEGVGLDLDGDDSTITSKRVRAWAATWGIRQFQQFGGVPVGLWREVRRVDREADVSPLIDAARSCVHRDGERQADYGAFVRLLGGPMVGRGALLSLAKRSGAAVTRYGVRDVTRVVGVADLQAGQTVETRLRTWRVVRRAATRCDLGLVSLTVRSPGARQATQEALRVTECASGELFNLEKLTHGTHDSTKGRWSQVSTADQGDLRGDAT